MIVQDLQTAVARKTQGKLGTAFVPLLLSVILMSEAQISDELDKFTTGDIATLLATEGIRTSGSERKSRSRLLTKLCRLSNQIKTKLLTAARQLPANPKR